MIERQSGIDPGVGAAGGGELVQAQLGIGPDVGVADGIERIEDGLDHGFGGWRAHLVWRRGQLVVDGTGAVDPPGATWRDRPGPEQGDDVFLAGDAVAAPGMLSEVSVNSAVRAARLALDARRRRVFAPGWPSAQLTPERRFAVLAAVLPTASLETAVLAAAELEPVDETGLGYRLESRAGIVTGTAVVPDPGGVRVTILTSSRWPEPAARVLRGLVRSRRPRRR